MSLSERFFDAVKRTVQLNDRVVRMADDVKQLARDVRDMDRRLVRVETALEMASKGQFQPGKIPDVSEEESSPADSDAGAE